MTAPPPDDTETPLTTEEQAAIERFVRTVLACDSLVDHAGHSAESQTRWAADTLHAAWLCSPSTAWDAMMQAQQPAGAASASVHGYPIDHVPADLPTGDDTPESRAAMRAWIASLPTVTARVRPATDAEIEDFARALAEPPDDEGSE